MVSFVLGALLSGLCLWLGSKLTGVDGTFITMLAIAAISGAIGFIPVVGFILGIVTTFILLVKWTGADLWPDAVLLVLVSNIVGFGVGMGLSRGINI